MTTTAITAPAALASGAAADRWITSVTDVVTIHPWRDAAVESMPGAMPTSSDDALVWYLPFLGSISLLMAHRWSQYASSGPSTWAVDDIARTFGIGQSVTRVKQSIDRLELFGIICRDDRNLYVRLWLPPLGLRQQAKLPGYLAVVYPS